MAKAKYLTILFLLLSAGCYAALPAAPEKLTTAAAVAPQNVTNTTDFFEDIINLKVKELHLNITPSFKVVLPDASVNLGLKQRVGDTVLEGMTEYNYIYNKIKYMLKYGLETWFPVSVSLYDNLEFEQSYNNKKYIHRTKGLGISLGTPVLFDVLRVGEEFRNESAYLAHLNSAFEVQQGLASIINTWAEYRLQGNIGGSDFDYLHLDFNFDKAIPHKDSRYNFLFFNSNLTCNFRFDNGNNLLIYTETGHMLEAQNVPLWKLYSIGGYDRLIGYGLNSFQGYYKVFGRLRYDGTIADNIGWEWWWFRLDNLKGFLIADCGNAGDVHQVTELNKYKYGVGTGFSFQFTFRKRTPVKVTFALGQPVESGKVPVIYFIYELL